MEETRKKELLEMIFKANGLRDLQWIAHDTALLQGFYDDVTSSRVSEREHTLGQLLHICIEAGELADKFRKTGEIDGEEAADIVIVLMDTLESHGLNLEGWIRDKMEKNVKRQRRYGVA